MHHENVDVNRQKKNTDDKYSFPVFLKSVANAGVNSDWCVKVRICIPRTFVVELDHVSVTKRKKGQRVLRQLITGIMIICATEQLGHLTCAVVLGREYKIQIDRSVKRLCDSMGRRGWSVSRFLAYRWTSSWCVKLSLADELTWCRWLLVWGVWLLSAPPVIFFERSIFTSWCNWFIFQLQIRFTLIQIVFISMFRVLFL